MTKGRVALPFGVMVHSVLKLPQASQIAPYDTERRVNFRNNPTQAKRRLEWATLLLLMAVIILPGIEALPWRAVVEQKAFVILRGFGSIA